MNVEQNIYIYNDNFNSLICLILELLKNNIKPYNIKDKKYNPNLLEKLIYLKIEEINIVNKLIRFVGSNNFKIIYYVYLSNNDNKELIIYYYILNYLKYRNNLVYMHNLKCVSEALKISKFVSRENHKFKGFVRFRELDNKVLYAEIKPENNIISILSSHFKKRLKNEFWMIKDVKRKIISVYDKVNFYIINEENIKILDSNINSKEKNIQDLWKLFYKSIGIKERKNEKCRMNFMPKKYWKYMLEVSDEIEKSS